MESCGFWFADGQSFLKALWGYLLKRDASLAFNTSKAFSASFITSYVFLLAIWLGPGGIDMSQSEQLQSLSYASG
jgi:hypothetical protein